MSVRRTMPKRPAQREGERELEDDELDDLPPIDGAIGDEPEVSPELDEIDDPEATDAGTIASLDDSTGEDEPPDLTELEGDESEAGWLDESVDSPEIDMGDSLLLDVADEGLPLEDAEDAPAPDEDFAVGESSERTTLDAAEEGPIGADEELKDADLPALDADDGPDEAPKEDEGFLDERVLGDEPLGVPWASAPWDRVGPSLGLASLGLARGITALASGPRGALIAGRAESGDFALVRVDLEGGRQVLGAGGLVGARILALATDGDGLAAVLEGGRLALSQDGGERFEILAVPEGVAAADVAFVSGVLWVRTRTGSLLVGRRDPGARFALERRSVPGSVVALCAEACVARDGAGMAALAVDEAGRPATLVRGRNDGTIACEAVQISSGRPAGAMTTRGEHVAFLASSARAGVLVRQPDAGWKRLGWDGPVTALAMLDEAGTLVAAIYSESDDSTGLIRVDGEGAASLVARLGAARDDAEADGRAVALALDDPRGVIWVAGGFGVAAFVVR